MSDIESELLQLVHPRLVMEYGKDYKLYSSVIGKHIAVYSASNPHEIYPGLGDGDIFVNIHTKEIFFGPSDPEPIRRFVLNKLEEFGYDYDDVFFEKFNNLVEKYEHQNLEEEEEYKAEKYFFPRILDSIRSYIRERWI